MTNYNSGKMKIQMLQRPAAMFIAVLVAAGFFAGAGCRAKNLKQALPAGSAVSVTNTASPGTSPAWVVTISNGPSFALQSNQVTVYFSIDNTVAMTFNPRTKLLSKILLETAADGARPGQWITDLNGDGIPDMRRTKDQEGSEVFFDGRWYAAKPMGGTNSSIKVEGDEVALFYDGHQWSRTAPRQQ